MPRKTACHTSFIHLPLFRRLLVFLSLLLLTAVSLNTASALGKTVLVFAPHPDDEALFSSGAFYQAHQNWDTVKVVLVTNGDAYGGALQLSGQALGLARQKETVQGMSLLGLSENDVIFLGYPDAYLMVMYNSYLSNLVAMQTNPKATEMAVVANGGQSQTYGASGLGKRDYHSYRNRGIPAPYTGSAVINDIIDLLKVYQPDEIYTVNHYDDHPDHSAVSLFVKDAIRQVMRAQGLGGSFAPVLYESMIWAPGSGEYLNHHSNDLDALWPAPGLTPDMPFDEPLNLYQTPFSWKQIFNRLVPSSMQNLDPRYNLKREVISAYRSQNNNDDWSNWLFGFVKKNEFFWRRDYQLNLALFASVTASDENPGSYGQTKEKAIDGIVAGYSVDNSGPELYTKEWVANISSGDTKAWIKLEWANPVTIDQINLYDRPNLVEQVAAGKLSFFDQRGSAIGTQISVGPLPNNGTVMTVNLDRPLTVKSVLFEMTAVYDDLDENTGAIHSHPNTFHTGLAEIEVLGKPAYAWTNTTPYFTAGPYSDIDEIKIENPIPPQTAKTPQTATIKVAGNDLDGSTLKYNWSTDGGSLKLTDATTAVFSPPNYLKSRHVFTITVTLDDGRGGTATNSTFVTVNPAVPPSDQYHLTLSTTQVTEGGSLNGIITFDNPSSTTNGALFILNSSNGNVVQFPPSVTFQDQEKTTTFPIATSTVDKQNTIMITSTHTSNNDIEKAYLTVVPRRVQSLQLNSFWVWGATTVTGTVTLDGIAAVDLQVKLSSSNPAVTLPTVVTVPAGSSSITFPVTVARITQLAIVTISASKGGSTQSRSLIVMP